MRRSRTARLAASLLALALASGAVLAQTPPSPSPATARRDAGAATPRPARAVVTGGDAGLTPAERERRAAVVARVGDQAITVGELEDLLNEAPAPVRAT